MTAHDLVRVQRNATGWLRQRLWGRLLLTWGDEALKFLLVCIVVSWVVWAIWPTS